MKAYQIMVSDVYKVNEKDTVRAVVEKFVEHNISGLPVVNDKNQIVAYISDGDIMRYIGKHKDRVIGTLYYVALIKGSENEYEERLQAVLDLNVLKIAQKKVHKIKWNLPVEELATILGEKHIKKLPVEREGVLVGIISRGDVIRSSFRGLL